MFWGLLTQEIFGGNLFEDVARAQEILVVQSYVLQYRFLAIGHIFQRFPPKISCRRQLTPNKIFDSDIIPPTEETKYSQLRKQNTAN